MKNLPGYVIQVKSRGPFPRDIPKLICDKALSKYEKEGSCLPSIFNFKIDARVMLLTDINIADESINGQFGTVKRCCYYPNSYEIEYIYIKFDGGSVCFGQKGFKNEEYGNCVYI